MMNPTNNRSNLTGNTKQQSQDGKINTFRQNGPYLLTNKLNPNQLMGNYNPVSLNQNQVGIGSKSKTGKTSRKK
jgi:hypothetical protein